MPDPGNSVFGFMVTFSSMDNDDDTPRCVVYAEPTKFYIACVGDKVWTEHCYENGKTIQIIASLVVCCHKVYFMDLRGDLFIYDMTNLSWKTVVPNKIESKDCNLDCQWLIMESEQGEILKINQGKDLKTFSFFKLNENETASTWEELNHFENRRWFLCDRNNHFCTKAAEGPTKVHLLRKYSKAFCEYFQMNPMIEIHNQGRSRWVDLGWMDKVPPSCKRYFPS
ncbi:hypothetical protein FRX31_014328 [Thalictrum thalictroides]|uniref:KIB1-4 beta-propeller domain-containing protein n=1 Tax=Thalictrum thalictroides TaxID=46969 RepID=A0A7J6WI33_THATH|nr:hypothetical protein FRX31_014328 [Thalictrum thalictroides]